MRLFGRGGVPDSERITAKNRSEAEARFVSALNEAFGYLTRAAQWRVARPQREPPWTLLLQPEIAPLPCDLGIPWYLGARVAFDFEGDTRAGHEGGVKAVVREYIYSLGVGAEDDAEVIAWHWHPRVENQPEPHVHVRATHADVPELAKLHIPTSRIFLEDVLLFAVDNLGARTREGGRDGLVRARDRTRRWATWGTAPRSQELG